MYVVIAGGGRTGTQLAKVLLSHGHTIQIIEDRRDVLARIHRELPSEVITEGNPVDPTVFEQVGIQKADVIAACTSSDEQNLSMCFIARESYSVPRTIARVNNPMNAWLFNDLFHVDAAVNQADQMARYIVEEMSMGDMMTLLKLKRGNYSLVEEKIPEGAEAIGIAIKDLKLPEHCVIAAIIRDGEVVVPRGVTEFQAGDEVLAVTDMASAQNLARLLSPKNNTGKTNSTAK